MTHTPFIVSALVAALAFGFADRWNGGGFGWDRLTVDHGGPLHGRGIYYAAIPLLGLCWLLGGLPGLWIGFIWGIYRAAFGFPSGTLTGQHMARTIVRHALVLPAVAFVLIGYHLRLVGVLPFVAYVAGAVVLAKWNGDAAKTGRGVNGAVECARGVGFGLAFAAALGAS